MGDEKVTRKLAAILCADVVGYSRLTGVDEEGTHKTLAEYLDTIAGVVASYDGHVVKYSGDAVLADFASAVAAVTCAVEIQKELASRIIDVPDDRKVQFRIGINLGDVIVARDDIFGNGVNVAARLESLADPGGVCISRKVLEEVQGKLGVGYEFLGNKSVKNIKDPIPVYRVLLDPAAAGTIVGGQRTSTVIGRRPVLIAAAVAVLLAVGVGTAVWHKLWVRGLKPVLSAQTIAVMPFSVRGNKQFDYLGEGIVNLLSTSLDGAGHLRSVNAHALLGFVGLGRSEAFSNKRARSVAEHFGAGLYVVGDIVEVGGDLRISASLFDQHGDAQARATESVEGEMEELFELVDRLAARLATGLATGASARRTRIAAMTTSSLPSLKAYLEGEQSYRSGVYTTAIKAFQKAVALDSTFALAFYRLSMAQERLAWADDSRLSAELAYRNSQRLSDHDRQFLEAVVALRRGASSEAEQKFRTIVRAYPDDAEAWYQLGELIFHGNPLHGGSMSDAREPLSRALFYDPRDLGPLYHLVRIAAKDRDRRMLDSLTDRFVELSPTGERTLELRALRAFTIDDTLDANSIVAELRKSPDTFLPLAVWSVATFAHDLEGGIAIARLMTEKDRPRDVQARGHFLLAHLELARGRLRVAKNELQTALELGDPGAREAQALFAALPFLSTPRAEVEQAVARLEQWSNAADVSSPRPSAFFSAHNGVHPLIRRYLLGLLAAKLGNIDSALVHASVLERQEGTAGMTALARQLAHGLRAQVAIAQGHQAAALTELEQLKIEGWYELTFVSPFYAGALERFALAELLLSYNRLEEALGWYVGLGENTVAELVFFGPSLLKRASIHEQLGQAEEARKLREHFQELWRDADPELLALVEAGQAYNR